MKHLSHWHRGTLVFLTLAISLALVAPAAEADHGRGRRYKGYRGRGPERVIYQRSSSAGPALAGFIGGLVVGAAIARPQPYYETRYSGGPRYSYGDPYCHERFSSLDRYGEHARRHHHALVAQVFVVSTGEHIDDCCYQDGRWAGGYQDAGYDDDSTRAYRCLHRRVGGIQQS